MNRACEKFVTTEKNQLEQLRRENFDVIFTEQVTFCGTGLAPLLAIPIHILLSSNSMPEHLISVLGLPHSSSWVPAVTNCEFSDKMTLLERFMNFILQTANYFLVFDELDAMTTIFQNHFGEDFPNLRLILKQSPFVFVNVDEFVEFPRPLFPHIVYIGGLGMDMDRDGNGTDLPEPFKREMTKGVKGVVFFSLGTVMRSIDLPETFRQNLFTAFAHFRDYHFIVKAEKGDNFSTHLTRNLSNVFLADWMPQTKLLNHPRLRLFISHSGYNSLLEAARAGVPFLAMPFFGDQYRNAKVPERNGWGVMFEKRKLLVEGNNEFVAVLGNVLENQRFASEAKRIQRLIRTKPYSGEERLQKSIRFLEENGGHLPELLPESSNMEALQLYNLDLILLLLALAFSYTLLLFGGLFFIQRRLWNANDL